MKISEKLIKIRKENNLSQEEFGNKINVSRQAVSKWENDETKPDIEKIQEIVKVFNISYEYLLNDEIETVNENKIDEKKKKRINGILKIAIIIVILYLLMCTYKFITFYRFYLVANSFSEKNYSMSLNIKYGYKYMENEGVEYETLKVGDRVLETCYSRSNIIEDEDGNVIPYAITYIDREKKELYTLNYDEANKKYICSNMKDQIADDKELEEWFKDKNYIKEYTLDDIPSNFGEILMYSINPMVYYVDIVNREFRLYSVKERTDMSVKLNKDCLTEKKHIEPKETTAMDIIYDYDYVQDHFTEIQNPLEVYKDKIIFEE